MIRVLAITLCFAGATQAQEVNLEELKDQSDWLLEEATCAEWLANLARLGKLRPVADAGTLSSDEIEEMYYIGLNLYIATAFFAGVAYSEGKTAKQAFFDTNARCKEQPYGPFAGLNLDD